MKKDDFILLIDSGNGGKFVYNLCKKELSNENLILFMDRKNCPYGNKSKEELLCIIRGNLDKILQKYSVKIIIIACNTLSSLLENEIKKSYKKYRIFFIKPLINQEILKQKTLVLATTNTINYNQKIQLFKNKSRLKNNLFLVGFDNLAKLIDDKNKKNGTITNELLGKLTCYKKYDIKNIVLGCTHYNYIKNELLLIFPNVKFFENSKNIINNVFSYLKRNNKLSTGYPQRIILTKI